MKKIISMRTIFVGSLVLIFCLGVYFSRPLQSRFLSKTITIHSSVVARDIPTYSKEATVIVIGTVGEMGDSYWQETIGKSGKTIQHDVTIHVEEVLKGDPDMTELTIVVQGGKIDHTNVVAEDEAKLKMGEKVLLFVGTTSDGDDIVFAGPSGKYLISDDETEATSIGDFEMPLEELMDQIENSLNDDRESADESASG